MTTSFYARVLGGTAVALALSVPSAQAQDAAKMRQLEQMIQQQQRALEEMKTQLDALQNATIQSKAAAAAAAAKADEAMKGAGPAKVVTSGRERVKLAISGQVNRGVLVVDDGEETDLYHVDNDNSSTRVRFVGTAKPTEEITTGAQIEVEMESNSSSAIDQTNENNAVGGGSFTERKLEVFFAHNRFGTVWLGQGDTASNGTSEVDLSGTDVITYSGIADVAGSMLFRNSATGALTTIEISDVYDQLDGLSRDDRIRYDTPKFLGFQLSASHVQGGENDYALRYSGQWGGFKGAAAVAYANTSSTGTNESRVDGSASVLHVPTGISLTAAGGEEQPKADGRANPQFWYGKVGLQRNWFAVGNTAMSVDFAFMRDRGQNDDEFQSWGLGLVQNVDTWGTEFYAAFRNHQLDRTGVELDDINAGMFGARIKF